MKMESMIKLQYGDCFVDKENIYWRKVMMTNDGRKQLLEIYFVLPFGVEATIYPWGITTIKEYIDKSEEQFCNQIVDFMRDHYFTKIVVKHRRVLKKYSIY
jgi:hypothetical protein